ncbi:MAG: VanZ family protein [Chitinophagaceae bacterium]|nr:MAG: VanZ family protein [Chitinophagaceae bacterium]
MKQISFYKFLPGIAWFFVVVLLTCLPGKDIPGNSLFELLHVDKWVHVFMFGLLAMLFIRPYAMSQLDAAGKLRRYFFVAISVSAWGLATEFIQKYLVPGRSFDIWDFVADVAGCSIAYIFAKTYMLNFRPNDA